MKRIVLFSILAVCTGAFASSAHAQVNCPESFVCITREAAMKALADSDRVKALESEVKVKDTAVEDMRAELNRMRVEFARVSGEATALRTNAVRDAALIELLMKYARPKKFGLINF